MFGKKGKIIATIAAGVGAAVLIGGSATLFSPALSGIIDRALTNDNFDFGEGFQEVAAKSDELCQKIGEEGIVMLKNEYDTLPFKSKKVNVFGWNSTDKGFFLRGIGSGSSSIREEKAVTLLTALHDAGWETNEELTKIYTDYDNTDYQYSVGSTSTMSQLRQPDASVYTDDVIDRALDFSNQAIVVISRNSGENVGEIPDRQTTKGAGLDSDRNLLELSKQEEDMLRIVTDNFDQTCVIINSSNTMELGFLRDDWIGAALNVSLTGQSGARAIPKILSGEVNPSGHTADTFPYDSTIAPSHVNYAPVNGSVGYFDGVYVGYRYYETADAEGVFDDVHNEYGDGYDGVVQFPFGYGLSYTTFKWELTNVSLPNNSAFALDSKVKMTFSCTNTGKVAGKDVMQVYGSAPYIKGGIEKSAIQLLDFAKSAELKPGQTQTGIVCEFSAYDFASYDCYDKNNNNFAGYELDPGSYKVSFRKDVHTPFGNIDDLTYTVGSSGLRFEKDPVTGNPIANRFTGSSAYAGVPLDGSTVFSTAPKYLSRTDFKATWPNAPTGPNASIISTGHNYSNPAYNQTQMPTTSSGGDLRLSSKDGSKIVYNEELIRAIAEDYDGYDLEDLVDQMSTAELKNLVEKGGFGTYAFDNDPEKWWIESIGMRGFYEFDGPAGFNQSSQKLKDTSQWTAFPAEVLLGQTWNKELAYAMGTSVANEGLSTGVLGWYAPGVNIHRTPYNGRNYEYFSEDPLLSGKMGANVVLGAKNHGLITYTKHFSMSEEGQNPRNVNTWTSEQAYREIYLRPFEIVTKEGKAPGMMSAFNNIGPVWAGACYAQNVEILRNEWGFRGKIITDYYLNSWDDMNLERGLRGGNDIWLNGNNAATPLSMSDATNVYVAKIAAKNIIYSFCDTYITYLDYDTSNDEIQVVIGEATVSKGLNWWRPTLIAVDVVGGLGLAVLLVFAWAPLPFMKKKGDEQ